MREIVHHSLIYTASNLASRGAMVVSLIVLPFLLTPAQYGALGLIVTLGAFVSVMLPLEVSQGLARYYSTAEPVERRRLAGTAWWFSLSTLGVGAIAALALAELLARLLFGGPGYVDAFRSAIGLFVVNTLILFLQSQCRWEFRILDYIWISVGYAVATLALSLLFAVIANNALVGALEGQVLGGSLVVMAAAWRLREAIFHRPNWPDLRRMLNFSLPLVPASIALAVGTYVSRLILNAHASLAEVGLLTFASQIATMPSLTVLGVQAALTPLIMAQHAEPKTPPAIARLFEGFVGLAAVACAGFGLFAEPAIRLAHYDAYTGAGGLVMILAPGFLALQVYIFAPGFAIAHRTKRQMWVTIGTLALGCLITYLLTDAFGVAGAAVAVLVSGLLFASVWFALSQRLYPVPFRWPRLFGFAAVWALVGWLGAQLPAQPDAISLLLRAGLLAGLAAAVLAFGLIEPSVLRNLVAGARARLRRRSAEA